MYTYRITIVKKVYSIDIYKSGELISKFKGRGKYTKASKCAKIIIALKKRYAKCCISKNKPLSLNYN